MDLEEVAQQLYGLLPGEFVSARNQRAKEARAAGQRELAAQIAGLRKPSTAAWVVNLLARRRTEQVAQMVELGAQMRQAHRSLDAAQLRTLDQQRKALIGALAGEARGLADELGQRVSEQVAGQVQQTLHAAMADVRAAAAVSAGLLTDSLEATGLGPVDLTGAVAVPVPDGEPDEADALAPEPYARVARKPGADRRERDADAEQDPAEQEAQREREAARRQAREELEQAEAALVELDATASRVQRRIDQARRRRERLGAERDRLQRQLEAVEDDLADAADELQRAEQEQDELTGQQRARERAVQQAREQLERLS